MAATETPRRKFLFGLVAEKISHEHNHVLSTFLVMRVYEIVDELCRRVTLKEGLKD